MLAGSVICVLITRIPTSIAATCVWAAVTVDLRRGGRGTVRQLARLPCLVQVLDPIQRVVRPICWVRGRIVPEGRSVRRGRKPNQVSVGEGLLG